MDVTWSATVMPLPTLKKALLVNEKMAMSPSRLAQRGKFWKQVLLLLGHAWSGERCWRGLSWSAGRLGRGGTLRPEA